jgi:hypothetical protein
MKAHFGVDSRTKLIHAVVAREAGPAFGRRLHDGAEAGDRDPVFGLAPCELADPLPTMATITTVSASGQTTKKDYLGEVSS